MKKDSIHNKTNPETPENTERTRVLKALDFKALLRHCETLLRRAFRR